MGYLSVRETGKKWNIKERKLTAFCRDNRIVGARKIVKKWMILSDALKPLDMRTKEFVNYIFEQKEAITIILYSKSNREEKVINSFSEKYNKKPMYTTFTPSRICPLGAHVVHNFGKITGFAIDKGIHIAYSKKENGVIEIE